MKYWNYYFKDRLLNRQYYLFQSKLSSLYNWEKVSLSSFANRSFSSLLQAWISGSLIALLQWKSLEKWLAYTNLMIKKIWVGYFFFSEFTQILISVAFNAFKMSLPSIETFIDSFKVLRFAFKRSSFKVVTFHIFFGEFFLNGIRKNSQRIEFLQMVRWVFF